MRSLPLVVLLCAGMVTGQELVWERVGKQKIQFGYGPTAKIGDVDGDGWPDLVHIVWDHNLSESQIWTLSGRDGSTLRILPRQGAYFFDRLSEAGDVDGDGIDDYAVRRLHTGVVTTTNLVELRSGRDDRLFWSVQGPWGWRFGSGILSGLDVDGDGRSDLVVNAPGAPPWPQVQVFNADGKLLYRVVGEVGQLSLGFANANSLGRVGDIDSDGCDDFVVAGGNMIPEPTGTAIVISGRTGQPIVIGRGEPTSIGDAVDGCGDIDGDNIPDFLGASDSASTGIVAVFSGATGAPIRVWTELTLGKFLFSGDGVRSGGMDFDRDGIPDIAVGSPDLDRQGGLLVLSGRDSSILMCQVSNSTTFRPRTGEYVTSLGAMPGSPFGAFVASEAQHRVPNSPQFVDEGRLQMYRGNPPGSDIRGVPCRGSLEQAPAIGASRTPTHETRVTVHRAPPGSTAILLLGLSETGLGNLPLPAPLDAIGFPGCVLRTSADFAIPAVVGTEGITAGYAAVDLPAEPTPAGSAVYAQWVCFANSTPEGGGVSDALELRLN